METRFYLLAVPLFLLAIGIEFLVAKKHKQVCYDLNEFVSNISCGLLEQMFIVPFTGFMIFAYQTIYQKYALFQVNSHSIFSWIFLWFGVDFLYYWFHRACHRSNFLWIGHSVHHQSEHFNLSVAVRQGLLQSLCTWIVYLPLALLGFPTWMFLIISTLITFYQFWIHSSLIKKLGWFEKIFNTPSHHRVHHGKNPEYIDKNYAGSLIIWDKLFGSFEKEGKPAQYGTTEPLNSWNPFYANIKVALDTFYYSKNLSSISKRILSFFAPPEWIVTALGEEKFQQYKRLRFQCSPSYSKKYMFFNIAMMFIAYSLFLTSSASKLYLWAFIISSLLQIAQILKTGKLDKNLEYLRFILLLFISYSVIVLKS